MSEDAGINAEWLEKLAYGGEALKLNGQSELPATPCSVWLPATQFASKPGVWWEGKRVRLLRELRTRGGDLYRKRRIAVVKRKFGGLELHGRKLYVKRVRYFCLEVETTPND